MTNDNSDDAAEFAKAWHARMARPMPLQHQRELAVCVDIDQLIQSLDDALAAFNAQLSAAETISADDPAATISARWKSSLADLKAGFDRVDRHGRGMIQSIKAMLALE